MYSSNLNRPKPVVVETTQETDDRTIEWLKKDLERRRERRAAGTLVKAGSSAS